MKFFVAVLRREVLERRQILLAAAIASLVPFAVPVVRGLHGANASDARQGTALILAAAFAAGLALTLGFSTLAGEIANRRIGFYWARPIPGWALWAGKLTGVWLLTVITAFLVCLPTLAIDRMRVLSSELPPDAPWLVLLVSLGAVSLSHILGIAIRSRTAWLIGDCIALGVAYFTIRIVNVPVSRFGAWNVVEADFWIAEIALAVGVVAGGAVAIVVGRTQIRRAHRAMSLTIWAVVAAGLAIAGSYSLWVLSATPSDLSAIYYVDSGAARGWSTVGGYSRTTTARFAFNVNDGRFSRVPNTLNDVAFSPDGSRAIWLQSEGNKDVRVVSWLLNEPGSKPLPTHVALTRAPLTTYLSPDGTMLAVQDLESLSVYELSSGALVASAHVPGSVGEVGQGIFVTGGRIRLFPYERLASGWRASIFEFDLLKKRLTRIGDIPGAKPYLFWVSPDGSEVVVRDRETDRLLLFDAETGLQAAVLLDGHVAASTPFCFLSRHRVAVAPVNGTRIRIVTRDGQIESDNAISSPVAEILGEPSSGLLSLRLAGTWTIGIWEVSSGALREIKDLHPLPEWELRMTSHDGMGADLFLTTAGSLITLDPVTLKQRVVLQGKASH